MNDIPPKIPPNPTRFVDQLRAFIRARNLAYSTEKTYIHWTLRFIRFHKRKHPQELGEAEIEAFLTHLAVNRSNSTTTQKTALNALMFVYIHFLGRDLKPLNFRFGKNKRRIPQVFSHDEALAVIAAMESRYQLPARLMYGAGLRVSECLRLRVKDVDFDNHRIIVRSAKGGKDRAALLPSICIGELKQQIAFVKKQHEADKLLGYGSVYLPNALSRKYPKAAFSLAWQYIFPANQYSVDPRSGTKQRHHIIDRTLQRAVARALGSLAIAKKASCHTFRHSFATQLLRQNYDIRTIQQLMGHSDVKTTEIYTHVIGKNASGVLSPLDLR
jgi:integron integrase